MGVRGSSAAIHVEMVFMPYGERTAEEGSIIPI